LTRCQLQRLQEKIGKRYWILFTSIPIFEKSILWMEYQRNAEKTRK
jgi:hypothetical protein